MKPWLIYALVTTFLWGIWGAFTETSEKNGFPGTLIYVVWALTMLIPAAVSLVPDRFRVSYDLKSIYFGMLIGITGSGGNVALFKALELGPAYLIFPIIALSPLITVSLSFVFLGERAGVLGWAGIVLALVSIILFSIIDPKQGNYHFGCLVLALGIMIAWGAQAYYMKLANHHMSPGSIFFYVTVSSLLFIPLALWMTDFSRQINWGFTGPGIAAFVQCLNAIGACTLIFAMRDGRAIVVAPLCNTLSSLITVLISLALYRTLPSVISGTAIVLSLLAALLIVVDEEREAAIVDESVPLNQGPTSL